MEYVHDQQYGNQLFSGSSVPDGEYFVEPYVQWGLPQTEVNVVVTVKLRSMDAPIVLSRPYIPVVKPVKVDDDNIEEFVALYDQIVSKPKKNGKFERGPIYDYQLQRLYSFRNYLDPMFEVASTQSEGCYDAAILLSDTNYEQDNIIINSDTDFTTCDCNFEWSYDKPKTPWAYEMSQSSIFYHACSWKFKAKLNAGDEWTVIDEQTDNTDWLDKSTGHVVMRTALFNLKEKNQPYQYFRLEITKKSESSELLLVKFKPLF
jgi:hypothetical protein